MRLTLTTLSLAAALTAPALLRAETAEPDPNTTGPEVEIVESDEAIPLPTPDKEKEEEQPAADDTPSPTLTQANAPLTREELAQAITGDHVSIPTPGELMAALGKEATVNWQSRYRDPIPTTFTSRAQTALNLGGLIADGYIALEAKDGQQIKNIGKDIIALARNLAVGENVIARGNSIIDFADESQWTALQEELEATQNEVKLALEEQRDSDLVSLVTVGAWIRGTSILSSFIDEHYSEPAARLLRQPGIVAHLRRQLATLPERIQSEKLVRDVDQRLARMEALVAFPEERTPSPEEVKELKELSEALVATISSKETP